MMKSKKKLIAASLCALGFGALGGISEGSPALAAPIKTYKETEKNSSGQYYHNRTLQNLEKLEPHTRRKAKQWYQYCVDNGIQVLVYETTRSIEKQRENVNKGASRTMDSYHLVGQALDFVPTKGAKTLWDGYYNADIQRAVHYAKSIGFEWGGDWKGFVDSPHLQYSYPSQPTDDITGGWYESAIRELNRRGIMVGEGNGVFAPNRAVTRAEFAQLISKSLNLPAGDTSFKDLNDANSTLRDGIKRTASAGIIVGRGDGYFDPNKPITREESAIIVNKALQYKGIWGPVANLPFSDKDQISYKEDVQRLYGLGIVKGKGDNQYDPKGTTTRGETATLILNMLQVIKNGSVQNIIRTAQINGIGVNVRSGSGTNYSIVRKTSKGEKVTVYEEKNGWLRIGTGEWIYYDSSYINYNR
ncbi:hypothetical protein CN558_24095 [Bacillus wiedmannii]|uniref:Peptidase M15 n=1 Tax=Bacillus wiedmannii TaxID=1890302 RepID=A0A2A8CCF5_9BACI|nr:S-layer homology domain-containing protein [Bacillus wiedmannii]PEL82473.1 hypothetical protein CN609_10115 [Bacillus wiedmannii]PEM81215.1 hypothetical protein CN627_29235 [Bacillus wiedmannii]PEO81903.1 hypothetical protein CN558_24095 [Bacillus wiedmannii]PFZ36017.1 hypothetical protein COL77_28985 [Bacillus wiedmannii]PGA83824.1 hypothetical protein COL94_19210 [Bacillus wiedmannii]